jgi:uncharacterized phage protein (TIGR02218 family)
MKSLGSLQTHYENTLNPTSVATLWKVTRRDLQVFGFTDHDKDIRYPDTYAGVIYYARTGFTGSQIATSAALSVDNLELTGFLDSIALTEPEMEAGLWDGADFEIFEVNWQNLSQGRNLLMTGNIGEMRRQGPLFVSELRGLSARLQTNQGRVVDPLCSARFGDARCGFDVASVTTTAVPVTSVTSRRVFGATSLGAATDYYSWGTVEFTTGENAGFVQDIKTFTSGGAIELQLPMPYPIAVADQFTIVPGCDKRLKTGDGSYTGDCFVKWDNVVNFRGFPEVPLINRLSQPPGG